MTTKQCLKCDGRGWVQGSQFIRACPDCNGSGKRKEKTPQTGQAHILNNIKRLTQGYAPPDEEDWADSDDYYYRKTK